MPNAKSYLPRLTIDEALISHNCQHNPSHRIHKGSRRLKVTEGRNVEHFCLLCGAEAIRSDISKLRAILAELEAEQVHATHG